MERAAKPSQLGFLVDQNMVEPVAALLNGRGHPVVRAAVAGLATATDAELVAYALARRLVIVTFDADLRDVAVRGACRVLHVRPPEATARTRVRDHYQRLVDLAARDATLITLPREGEPTTS